MYSSKGSGGCLATPTSTGQATTDAQIQDVYVSTKGFYTQARVCGRGPWGPFDLRLKTGECLSQVLSGWSWVEAEAAV